PVRRVVLRRAWPLDSRRLRPAPARRLPCPATGRLLYLLGQHAGAVLAARCPVRRVGVLPHTAPVQLPEKRLANVGLWRLAQATGTGWPFPLPARRNRAGKA